MRDARWDDLRLRAEARLAEDPETPAGKTDLERLMHEMSVHHIELEMQNVDLRRIGAELEGALTRFRTLYDSSPVGYCTLNRDGRIKEINLTAARFLGKPRSKLLMQHLSDDLPRSAQTAYARTLEKVFAGDGEGTCEFSVLRGDKGPAASLRAQTIIADEGNSCFVALIDVTAQATLDRERGALSKRLVAAQEETSRRISADLHDKISGNLAALDFLLATVEKQSTDRRQRDAIAEIQGLLRATAAHVRTVCNDLRPPSLELAGLAQAIEEYAKSITTRFGVPVTLQAEGDCRHLSQEQISGLFRIVQEALTNCGRHSRATEASVRLECSDEKCTLEIRDNGVGFSPETSNKSRLGLQLMRERAEHLGAAFSISSKKGYGTVIQTELLTPPRNNALVP